MSAAVGVMWALATLVVGWVFGNAIAALLSDLWAWARRRRHEDEGRDTAGPTHPVCWEDEGRDR